MNDSIFSPQALNKAMLEAVEFIHAEVGTPALPCSHWSPLKCWWILLMRQLTTPH